jgi:transcriptional repressor NrdR
MQCPSCKYEDTKVIDSRANDGSQVRRRRECLRCEYRFTTYETIEMSLPRLVKRDGSFVIFDDKKLRAGIMRAVEKRPVSNEAIDQIIGNITKHLLSLEENEIATSQLGELVMQELKQVDNVAYVRFASVYRRFTDITDFMKEINSLKNVTDQHETIS